ncbi:hypothetical protein [Persephonella sp.]|uniref:hypothetical protein n=1 Tax=Persephonella sp. TaxID=2060922 RepID=UPI00262EC4AE|nr:hypothetical protein [Persephonella sp.]
MLSILLKLVNKRFILYGILIALIAGVFLYQKLKIEQLKRNISQIRLQSQQIDQELKLCKSNNKTFLENINSKDKVIKQLQQNLKNNQKLCRKLLKSKDKLISDLQKLKQSEPKDIQPKTIVKKNCKIKIETREALNEKDIIFNVLNSIGK